MAIASTQQATNLDSGDADVSDGPRRGRYANASEIIPDDICRDWYFRNNCTRGAQCRWRHERFTPDGGEPVRVSLCVLTLPQADNHDVRSRMHLPSRRLVEFPPHLAVIKTRGRAYLE